MTGVLVALALAAAAPARAAGPVAHTAGAFIPNDPAFKLQWNFWGPNGINAPEAWDLAARRGAPGGLGAVVAVLDTGVAYRDLGPVRRAPDGEQAVKGYDFVDDDPHPLDANGHGTHVAGTIAEATDNGLATAGIAYHARIMPVRVLDDLGNGDSRRIARGIRYAVRHGADVINLSLEFARSARATQMPEVLAALREAHAHDIVVTAVAGNDARTAVPYPAAAPGVIAVGATTERGCRAKYSNSGTDVDVVAPGGGSDAAPADDPWDQEHCRPGVPGRSIYQQTYLSSTRSFGLPGGYYGTSMASPHVAALAALIIASKIVGPAPSADAVEKQIEDTARDIGAPGPDPQYGHGLIDAGAALRTLAPPTQPLGAGAIGGSDRPHPTRDRGRGTHA
jgi:serine protease